MSSPARLEPTPGPEAGPAETAEAAARALAAPGAPMTPEERAARVLARVLHQRAVGETWNYAAAITEAIRQAEAAARSAERSRLVALATDAAALWRRDRSLRAAARAERAYALELLAAAVGEEESG